MKPKRHIIPAPRRWDLFLLLGPRDSCVLVQTQKIPSENKQKYEWAWVFSRLPVAVKLVVKYESLNSETWSITVGL